MNFQNLEYFIAAANDESISKAAEKLRISQQALSGNIMRLEEELGCKLFDRRPNLELTYSGKCFFETAQAILDMQRQSQKLLSDINNSRRGELRIGISHTRGQTILPLLLPDFSRMYPLVDISISEATTEELEKSLEKGSIDIMIGFMPVMFKSAEVKLLARDRLFLVLPKSLLKQHFGEKSEEICRRYREKPDLSLFKDFPFVLLKKGERIRKIVDREFAAHNITPNVKIETRSIQTTFSLATEGMGVCVFPEMYLNSIYMAWSSKDSYARGRVELLPLLGEDNCDTIGIGYNRDRYLSHIAADFIKMSVEKCRSLGMTNMK